MSRRRAILLARELPFSELDREPAGTPGLISVANRPLVAHIVEELAAAGVDQVTVVGPETVARDLRTALAPSTAVALDFIEINGPQTGAAILERIRGAEGTIVIHSGECLLGEELGRTVTRVEDEQLDALGLTTHPMGDEDDPLDVQVLRTSALADLTPDELSARLFDRLGAKLIDMEVESVGVERGWWYQQDDDTMLAANRLILDRLEPSVPAGAVRGDSQVQGTVSIDPTAIVDSSIVRGPVIIGPGARLIDAYVGPYTAVGANVVVENSEIEHSMVMEGAQVRDVGTRLESSVIGPGADVRGRFTLPRAIRLQIGAGARVVLS